MATPLITGAALIHLATMCGGPDAPVDLITRIVMHESGGNPAAAHLNDNGTTDYGLMQVNSSNLSMLGETAATILDPCRNIHAGTAILRAFSGYATGSLSRGFTLNPPGSTVSYVVSMSDPKYRVLNAASATDLMPPPTPCAAPAYDTWGQAECRRPHAEGEPSP